MFVSSALPEQVASLHEAGLSCSKMASQLGVARSTIEYHLRRLRERPSAPAASSEPPPAAQRPVSTREAVAALLASGLTRAEIARRLGLAKATVSYHARRLDQKIDGRCARRYDWELIQGYYDQGHSVRECMAAFGFSSASWFEAVRRGAVQARPTGMPIEELLQAGTYRGRYHLKARLIAEGLKENRCERCGVTAWLGAPITLALHHVNGLRDDNRLENLQILCPNCHSQTDTFAGRNGRGLIRAAGATAVD